MKYFQWNLWVSVTIIIITVIFIINELYPERALTKRTPAIWTVILDLPSGRSIQGRTITILSPK